MASIKKLFEKEINGLHVDLFEFDINDEKGLHELQEYLIGKVRISKVHNITDYDLTYYGSKNMNPQFVKKFNEQVAKMNIPKKAILPQFDVKRERVTEWMAQFLLEREFGCRFFDEADKRINLKPVEIDKHTDGIDVPGVWFDNGKIKFVVCEVKASETPVPSKSAQSLQQDIQKAIDNHENRVSREILQYIHGIRNVNIEKDVLQKIVSFLAQLIVDDSNMKNGIMFFPVLIRNNSDIINKMDVGDFQNLCFRGVDKDNVESIILHFGKKFDSFSDEIYKTALGI